MTQTTVKRMDLVYMAKRPDRTNGRVSSEAKQAMLKYCRANEIKESDFLNLAIVEKLERLGKL